MIKIKLSYHAQTDRLDRLATILQTIELGEIIKEQVDNRDHTAMRCLTSTGIILVKSLATGRLVTGFMATVEQASALYGAGRMPSTLYQTIKYNNKKYAFLLKM